MKSNIIIMSVLTGYFVLLGTIYTVWHMFAYNGEVEWGGTMAIYACAAMTSFIGVYLFLGYRKQGGQLVEDLEDSDIDDGNPELGEFSPWSWWPLALAFPIALVALGFAIDVNYWLVFLALPLVLVGVVGFIYEYYRGHFAR